MDNKNILETRKQVKLLWPLENELPAVYANQAAISVSDNEVTLVFGSFLPMGMHGRDEQEVNDFLNPAIIQPVAKIVMTKNGFNAIYSMLEKYVVKKEQESE